jgi:hypothetical protein
MARIKKSNQRRPASSMSRRARLGVEALEQRELMAGNLLSFMAPSGNGTNNILLRVNAGNLEVLDNNVLAASQPVASTSAVALTGGTNTTNTINIQSTAAGVPTTVTLTTIGDTAKVGNTSNGVQSILGALTIQGFGWSTVTVDDTADTGTRIATLGSKSVTGLAQADINFSGVSTLTVDGGKASYNVFSITGTPGLTNLYDNSNGDYVYLKSTSGTAVAYGLAGDWVYLYGSANSSNSFYATPTYASISGTGFFSQATGFKNVISYSSSASDTAYLYGNSSGTNTFTGDLSYAAFSGNNFFNEAIGFHKINAISSSASDVAYLNGGSGTNTFTGTSTYATLSGSGYTNEADGFHTVIAYGSTVNDVARLSGSSGGVNTFNAQPGFSNLYGSGYNLKVYGFANVIAHAATASDTASIDGASTGVNDFEASPTSAVVSGTGYSIEADAFARVDAYSCSSYGQDFADLTGPSSGTNTFVAYSSFYGYLSGSG